MAPASGFSLAGGRGKKSSPKTGGNMRKELEDKRQDRCLHANLGQTEAQLQQLSKLQMRHMSGDKYSALASRQKSKIATHPQNTAEAQG
jgi:hypothetical protein